MATIIALSIHQATFAVSAKTRSPHHVIHYIQVCMIIIIQLAADKKYLYLHVYTYNAYIDARENNHKTIYYTEVFELSYIYNAFVY